MADLDAIEPQHSFSLWLFILCLAVPLAAFGGFAGLQHLMKKDSGPRAQMKEKAYQALKTADAALKQRRGGRNRRFPHPPVQSIDSRYFLPLPVEQVKH